MRFEQQARGAPHLGLAKIILYIIKLYSLENSRGLNSQFGICSCVRALNSLFQKFRAFLIQEIVTAFLFVFLRI